MLQFPYFLIFLFSWIFLGEAQADSLVKTPLTVPERLELKEKFEVYQKINILIPKELGLEMSGIYDEINFAQKIWGQCEIGVVIQAINEISSTTEVIRDYESIEFNSGSLSDHEEYLFSSNKGAIPQVLYVQYLDWSYDANGTRAISYPPFILEYERYLADSKQREFYKNNMLGSVVLSQFRELSTLAHEWGHSLFNLKHSDSSSNLMIGTVLGQRVHFEISESQCAQARLSIEKNFLKMSFYF